MSAFNRPNFTGTNRSHFFASSKGDISCPMVNVVRSDKFSSTTSGQTIVTFETKTPVSWNDARDLIGHGTVVTMCKAPIQELDGAMFGMMVDALRKSNKWVHTPGVQPNRSFFHTTDANTVVASDIPPVSIPGVVQSAIVVKREKAMSPHPSSPSRAEKREREVYVISDDEDVLPPPPVARSMLPTFPFPKPTLPETQQVDSQDAWL